MIKFANTLSGIEILKKQYVSPGRLTWIAVQNKTTEKTVEIRALVSAGNSSDAWDLRCLVREKLIDFMQRNYSEKLPFLRLEKNKKDKENGK